MISYIQGKVIRIINKLNDVTWIELIDKSGNKSVAINYNDITGDIDLNDEIIVNTTAVELSLGTGGQHFVIYNKNNECLKLSDKPGHIMKLRYTPNQIRCLTVEEQDSPYHEKVKEFESLDGHIVVVATLHSMLAPIAAIIRELDNEATINYIMTDDGALPMGFSNNVRQLKELNILNNTITVGHAFGGDYECTNLYTGLITSKDILKGDVTIVAMGPGIVGTGTKYGFTGIEQATHIDIINKLGGKAISVPRISFSDKRERHYGISHHSLTILGELTNSKSIVVFPELKDIKKLNKLKEQIEEYKLNKNHEIIFNNGDIVKEVLNKYGLNIKTMGRNIDEDPEFFKTLGSVGLYVSNLLNKE